MITVYGIHTASDEISDFPGTHRLSADCSNPDVPSPAPLPFPWPRNGAPDPRARYGCVPPVVRMTMPLLLRLSAS
jgi:hypothetical protein